MEPRKRVVSILIGVLMVALTRASALGVGPPPYEVRVIARDAYIFTYPLVLHYRAMYQQAIDPAAKEYAGGFGLFRYYGPNTAETRDVAAPEGGLAYMRAQVDLRAEPWVLTLPQTDGRYLASQWNDLWGFVLDTPGALKDGSGGGSYLLVGPNWKGKAAEKIKGVIQGESQFMGTLTRIALNDPEDPAAIEAIRQGCTLQPLSSFLGMPPPPPAPKIRWPAWKPKAEKTADFFAYVNFLLPFTQPDQGDRPMLDRMAKIGIGPGKPWNTANMDPATRQAIEEGIGEAWKLIRNAEQRIKDGDRMYGSRQQLGTDYLRRTLGVARGMFGAPAEQAVEFTWSGDADGKPLAADRHRYTVTFPKGGGPQAAYFWTISMYNQSDRQLADNPLGRFSIGSRTAGLKTGADGAVTILLQKNAPGPAKESNWLPAPNGPFFAVLRVYGPGEAEQSGKWKPPAIRRID